MDITRKSHYSHENIIGTTNILIGRSDMFNIEPEKYVKIRPLLFHFNGLS
jgi:hypothetical protein